MSEPTEEIEEGEIVEEEVYEEEEDEEDDMSSTGEMDIASLMTSLMATPDGDTVCSALVNIAYQLQTQNKILIKIMSRMNSA
jgi:hypothetical protein